MLVLAAVPDIQYVKLRRAAAGLFSFVHVGSWDEALWAIRVRPVELAVVDPLLPGGGGARGQEIGRLRLLFPSLPLILYTSLTPDVASVLLSLGKQGITYVVFSRFDDHPARLNEVLRQEGEHSASRQLLAQLAEGLAPLSPDLRWLLEGALHAPDEVQTVQQLAARANIGRRTCERRFARLGLPSPRHFLAAARVLYAHRLLQDPGFTIEDVAQRLGYARVKTLQQHARNYLGLTAGEMRLSLSIDEALQAVLARFRGTAVPTLPALQALQAS